MKKKCCILLAIVLLLSTMAMPIAAVQPDNGINENCSSSEDLIVFNPKTRIEERITMYNDLSCSSRSSTPLISEPYTPSEKISKESDSYTRSIIGSDDRLRVDDPSVSPFCKIVFIRSYYANNVVVRSTGVILGPDLVLTCAHAIYRSEFGGWPSEVRVYTEVDGVRPLDDDYAGKTTTQMVIPAAWADPSLSNQGKDWAYMYVDSPIGYQQGWMGFGTVPTTYNDFNVTGYPDCAPGEETYNNFYMYTDSGVIDGLDDSGTMFYYSMDTSTGQSGAPLYTDSQIVYGIHVLGGSNNQATKISNSLYNYLVAARQEGLERWNSQE